MALELLTEQVVLLGQWRWMERIGGYTCVLTSHAKESTTKAEV